MSRKKGALLVFAVALVTHIAFVALRGAAIQADGIEYQRLADNLRNQHTFSLDTVAPFEPSVRRAPGFPLLVALIGSVIQPEAAATVGLHVLMDSVVAVLVFLLASTLIPLRAALLPALLYAAHPANLYWSRMLHSEISFTFFTMSGLYLLVRALARRSLGLFALGGALLGAAALTRPVGTPFLLVAAVTIFFVERPPRRFLESALVLVCGVLVILPWVVRSSRLAHRFVMIGTTSTVNLYIGTRSGEPIYSDVWFHQFLASDPCGRGFMAAHTAVEATRADDVCTAGAVANIKAHPMAYLRGRVPALVRMVTSSFDLTLDNQRAVSELRAGGSWGLLSLKVLLFLGFCVVPLSFAAVGLRRSLATPAGALCAALWLYTIAVMLPGYTEFRYFVPAVPAMLVTAGVGWHRLAIYLCKTPLPGT